MPLFVPQLPFHGKQFYSHSATRPSTGMGAVLTAGAGSYSSYVEVISDTDITEDCCGITIICSVGSSTSTAIDGTLTVGKDETGGTSYTDWIEDLITGQPPNGAVGLPCVYYFPLYIKAGTSIAVKYASANGTGCRVMMKVHFMPKNTGHLRVAQKVQTFGGAAAGGTAVVDADRDGGVEPAWTQIGSSPTSAHWWWQVGIGPDNNSNTSNVTMCVDVAKGDASNKIMMFDSLFYATRNVEYGYRMNRPWMASEPIGLNDLLYARCLRGVTNETIQVALYGCT